VPRTSIEELILKDGGLAAEPQRPDVPYDLDDEAAVEWRRIVNCMPASHFIPANYHMLGLLCRHIVEARRVSRLIRNYCNRKDPGNVKIYLDLCRQQTIESTSIQKYSRSCRITHQSTLNKTAVNLKRIAAQTIDLPDEQW